MRLCLNCQSPLQVVQAHCRVCNIHFEGNFFLPRLARLASDHMKLAETFLLSGGNLKAMTEILHVSYPTLRKRVNDMISALRKLKEEDVSRCDGLLDAVEKGKMTAEEAARIGKEMNGAQ